MTVQRCGHPHPYATRYPCIRLKDHTGKHRYGALIPVTPEPDAEPTVTLTITERQVELLGHSLCLVGGFEYTQPKRIKITRAEASDQLGRPITDMEWDRLAVNKFWEPVDD